LFSARNLRVIYAAIILKRVLLSGCFTTRVLCLPPALKSIQFCRGFPERPYLMKGPMPSNSSRFSR
jgi:hypothetical protein